MSKSILQNNACKCFAIIIVITFLQITFSSCSRPQKHLFIEYPHKYHHLISTIPTQYLSLGKTIKLDISNYFLFEIENIQILPNDSVNVIISNDKRIIELSTDINENRLEFLDYIIKGKDGLKINGTILIRLSKSSLVTLRYSPDKPMKDVYLAGSFNNWNNKQYRMEETEVKGTYSTTISLDEGDYQYKFLVDGEWIIDPNNPEKLPDGFGEFNSVISVGQDNIKRIKIIRHFKYIDKRKSTHLIFRFIPFLKDMDNNSVKMMFNNQLLTPSSYQGVNNLIDLRIPYYDETSGIIRINGKDSDGNFADELIVNLKDNEQDHQFDWTKAIIYSAVTDRFYNGDKQNDKPIKDEGLDERVNFYGGDFRGITDKINEGYFDKLGVNAIIVSPVNKQPENDYQDYSTPNRKSTGYKGCWSIQPREIEMRFGSLKELQKLIETAHKHNIKVILSYIPNYTHIEHPYYKEHPDWYNPIDLPDGRKNIRLFDESPFTTWFDVFLPSFNFINSNEALEQVTDDILWWLKITGADGLNFYDTNYIPHNYFKTLTQKIRNEFRDEREKQIFQIGETKDSREKIKQYLNVSEIDSQFDYPLYEDLVKVFAKENMGFTELDKLIQGSLKIYNVDSIMCNFLGNDDISRFMTFADGDLNQSDSENEKEYGWTHQINVDNPESYEKIKSAFAFLFTVPGIPLIYYGDEIGMTGAGEPDNCRPMRFGNDVTDFEKGVYEYISFLSQLRKNHPVLTENDLLTLFVSNECYIYLKSGFDEKMVVAINKFQNKKRVKFKFPFNIKDNSFLQNLSNGELNLIRDNECTLTLYPQKAEFYTFKENILGFSVK